MKTSLIATVPAILCVLSLPGCGAEHATAVEISETHALAYEGAPVADDPFGSCSVQWRCDAPAEGCIGYVDPAVCEGDCVAEKYQVSCLHLCEESADCPVPLTGSAASVCHEDVCQLPCDDAACPVGYDCVDVDDHVGRGFLPRICLQTFVPKVEELPEGE